MCESFSEGMVHYMCKGLQLAMRYVVGWGVYGDGAGGGNGLLHILIFIFLLSIGSRVEWFLGSGCSSQVIRCLISKQHGMSEVGVRAVVAAEVEAETGSRLPFGSLPSSSSGAAAGAVEGSVSLLFLTCRFFSV